MFALILAVLLPSLCFGAFLVLRSAEHEQRFLASTVRERAESAATALDLLLSTSRARLFRLASAAALDPAGMAQFFSRVTNTTAGQHLSVALSDPAGQEIFNTHAQWGDRLPVNPDPEGIRNVVVTGLPYVSDLTIGITGKPVVMLNIPLTRDGKVVYVLSEDILPLLGRLLVQLHLPPDWLCLISDRNGYTLARTRNGDRFVGQVSQPGFLARVRSASQGWFAGTSRDGVPSYVGFTRARLAGWTVAVAIPANELLAPVHHSTHVLVLSGLSILILALLAAFLIARGISRPISRLVAEAQALGGSGLIPFRPTGLQETDDVARSLCNASEQLARHAADRDAAMATLRESEGRFRALAEELGQANAERSKLLHATVVAQEAERARVSRELHDSLGQYLTALHLGLKGIAPDLPPAAAEEAARLSALTAAVGRETKRLAWELRPTALDDLGLETAMRQLIDNWAERSGLAFDLHVALGSERLLPEVETTLYRVLQEALTNAVKHADATRVAIVLDTADAEVRLIVEDDGRGLVERPPSACGAGTGQLGLIGMRERLALVKGRLELECGPGKGTTLFARIPL